jgi:hypothetical protein
MLRRFGTKEALYQDDRTGKLKAKLEWCGLTFSMTRRYRMPEDGSACAHSYRRGLRKASSENDNPDRTGRVAA